MAKKTQKRRVHQVHPRPDVPDDFPLSWHKRMGKWYKKIHGHTRYFGRDPDEALELYAERKHYYEAGIEPPGADSGVERLTVRIVANRFMEATRLRFLTPRNGKTHGITPNTYHTYESTAKILVKALGAKAVADLTHEDFTRLRARLNTGSAHALRRAMTAVRSIFKFGAQSPSCDMGMVDFGPDFRLSTKRELKAAIAHNPPFLFEADLIRNALTLSSDRMKACILLGINCGFYSKDISDLRIHDVRGEWLVNMRQKASTDRKCWLWPETREALQKAAYGPNPEHRMILSTRGQPLQRHGVTVDAVCECGRREVLTELCDWTCPGCARVVPKIDLRFRNLRGSRKDLVRNDWRALKSRLGISGQNTGFKNFRHTYATIAAQVGDMPALQLTLGHTDGSVTDLYVHNIREDRLRAVSFAVRIWLHPDTLRASE